MILRRPIAVRFVFRVVLCCASLGVAGCGGAGGAAPARLVPVRLTHAGHAICGTLTLPASAGPHPAVVLVLGSGAQDRNYGGVAPRLAAFFARRGFACLACDKPGVGASTGDFNDQTLDDRADEAVAMVHFLQARPDVRKDCVGLWGHSQGGMVAPLAAARSRDVAFVIEVSGWQGPAWPQDAVRVECELRAAGFPEADVRAGADFARLRMDLIRGDGPFEELDAAQQRVKDRPWFAAVHACDRTLFESARKNVNLDTTGAWESVHCPVLALYGDRDTSSGPPGPLTDIIRSGLGKAHNDRVRVRVFHNADHSLFATDEAGHVVPGETPAFVEGYLETMGAWLVQLRR